MLRLGRYIMDNLVIMHINYCEQGQPLAEACKKAVDWGYDGIEFRMKRHTVEEPMEKYLDELSDAVAKSGLKEVLFGSPGPDLTSADSATREKEIENTSEFLKITKKRFNTKVYNTFTGQMVKKGVPYSDYTKHGSFMATNDHFKWAADGFKKIGKVAEELNIKLAFETHMCYLHDYAESAKKLIDMIGSSAVGANLDFGNSVYMFEDPSLADAINLLKNNLYYVHLKNSIATGDKKRVPTLIEDGEINHRQYLKLLKEINFTGPIGLEAPRPGDREWFAVKDLAYIKALMAEI